MGGISEVADEAAHSSPRQLFERCHELTILDFCGWVGFSEVADEAIQFSPLIMAGCEMPLIMFYRMGWLGFSAVSGEADKDDRGGVIRGN